MTNLCKCDIIKLTKYCEKTSKALSQKGDEKMVVFEMTSRIKGMEVKKVLIANYVANDERLFQVNLAEAEIISEDTLVNIGAFTTIKRHTDAGFILKQFQAGDQVLLSTSGEWKVKHSLKSYMIAVWRRWKLFRTDLIYRFKNALQKEELGTIKREIQQNFCCYIESH